MSEFERRQLTAIRNEFDRAHAERTAPVVNANVSASPARLFSRTRTSSRPIDDIETSNGSIFGNRQALTRAGLRERPLFSDGRGSGSDELFLDLFVDGLKPTFGAGRAISEELDLGL